MSNVFTRMKQWVERAIRQPKARSVKWGTCLTPDEEQAILCHITSITGCKEYQINKSEIIRGCLMNIKDIHAMCEASDDVSIHMFKLRKMLEERQIAMQGWIKSGRSMTGHDKEFYTEAVITMAEMMRSWNEMISKADDA